MNSNGTILGYIAPEADQGDAFTFNLVSDLGPLLSLFGEQVAKQFMSESMGWSDHILFAMAPLGIITAIVGSIRVAGPKWLKAIIGRARENRATAEQELMSSASHEVCEMWDGLQIVRIPGEPAIRELIHISSPNTAGKIGSSTGTALRGYSRSMGTNPATDASSSMSLLNGQDKRVKAWYTLRQSDVFEENHLTMDGKVACYR